MLHRFVRSTLLTAAALSVFAGSGPVTAADDAAPAVRYALAAWSNEESGDVLSIAQDLDGYLWLGTQDGPVRFDGARFTRWASGSSDTPARFASALASSAQGGLWAGFGGVGGVTRIQRGGATH